MKGGFIAVATVRYSETVTIYVNSLVIERLSDFRADIDHGECFYGRIHVFPSAFLLARIPLVLLTFSPSGYLTSNVKYIDRETVTHRFQ